jgi:isoleucyl-tRNA synthetase
MLCSGSPWAARRVGHGALEEIVRKVLLTYWNTASFLTLYAGAAGWEPGTPVADVADRPLLDRWALSELHRTVTEVDAAMEDFDTARAGKRLAAFVDDLSNWYVRRSRRRFWDGDPAALATLHECLEVLTRLLAPFTPFLTDRLWQALVVDVAGPGDAGATSATSATAQPDSVHLAAWPQADGQLVDDTLGRQVSLVRRLVELGRASRASAKVRTRQPLARALVSAVGFSDLSDEMRREIADELNVGTVDALVGELVDVSVKANFRALGKRFGKQTPVVAKAIADAGPPVDGRLTVVVDGEDVELSGDELIVTETPRAGWTVANEGGVSIALDLELTPELRRAGLAREVVRVLQDARKRAGLDISDRIELWWAAPQAPDLAQALRESSTAVAEEVLATTFAEGPPSVGIADQSADELGLTYWLRVAGG